MTREATIKKMRDSVLEYVEQVAPFYDALDWAPHSLTLSTEEGVTKLIHDLLDRLDRGSDEVESGGIVVGLKRSISGDAYNGYITFKHTAHFYGDGAVLWMGHKKSIM